MLARDELKSLLFARGKEQERLFERAREVRGRFFGNEVILRGVIEITNVCHIDCDYCPMRRSNALLNERYVVTSNEIVQSVRAIRKSGINIVMLQGGETISALTAVEQVIPEIRRIFEERVETLLNLGCFSKTIYARLFQLGCTSYIVKHETSDAALHERIRHQSLQRRLRCLADLRSLGYRTGTGLIAGLPGQSLESILNDIELAGHLNVEMCSVSPFIPAKDTPMQFESAGDLNLALNIISCLRLAYPKILIPSVSALERLDQGGQFAGLQAGANVLTANFSPDKRRDSYLIYGKERFIPDVEHIRVVANKAGLQCRGSIFVNTAEQVAI